MNRQTALALAALIIVVAGGAWYFAAPAPQSPEDTPIVLGVVNSFGTNMRQVSLMDERPAVAAAIEKNYGPLVSSQLLKKWSVNPETAPGRLVSSPWPERIEITSAERDRSGVYTVRGNVVELTSKEVTEGGIAGSYPVVLRVEKRNGAWVITDFSRETETL